MLSRCTIGAIASKNASASALVSRRMVSASAGEVSGPVATTTWSHSDGDGDDFLAPHVDQRVLLDCRGDRRRKALAINRQRTAGGHLMGVGSLHDQRAQLAHLGMQQPDRVMLRVVGAKRIGTHEFGQAGSLVDRGAVVRAHLMQDHGHAAVGDLPRRLAAGETPADDVHLLLARCHGQ